MHLKRGNAGRSKEILYAVIMTLLLIALLIFNFLKYDRVRTLRAALEKVSGDPLLFSADSGFYEKGFVLKLGAEANIPRDDSIEIRYTVDGNDPAADSLLYEGGIDLEEVIRQLEDGADEASSDSAPDEYSVEGQYRQWKEEKEALASGNGTHAEPAEDGIHIIPVRARLVQGDDTSSIVTRTYVIGQGVFERYDAYVACISTDQENLFDYDKGIMVRGSNYQKDIDEGKREDRSGNFYHEGEDWIKDGHVTLFSPEGEVLLEEDAPISVGGYSSRVLPTRSLRAEASTARGSSDDYFHLDMFKSGSYSRAGNLQDTGEAAAPDAEASSSSENSLQGVKTASNRETGTVPDAFRKLRFRTHGVPYYRIRSVRNEFAKKISDACGFPGLPEARLGVAYLNGEFYTACDITPSVTKEYMCSLFGLNTPDAIEEYDSSDYNAYKDAKILNLLEADLTQTDNQKALEEAVDMDNYLFYFALETLLNNSDWPFNNVTMWRYLGEEDPENPYTDGRFRFLLDDMDQILTNDLHSMPEHWSTELLDYLMKDEKNTFHHVMQCKEYRDTFLTYIDDLLRTVFEPEYACSIFDALYADMKREYILDYGETFWSEMEETIEITKNNVREKEALYRADVTKYMGLEDRYNVTIEAGEGVSITWNNMTVTPGGSWSNDYYCGTAFTITAQPEEGYRFAGWEINGQPASADESDESGGDAGSQDGMTLVISDELAAADSAGTVLKVRALTEPAR